MSDQVEVNQNSEQDLVSVEILPVGRSADRCEGALLRLVRAQQGDACETSLMVGLGPQQCRDVARQLLSIADLASGCSETTLLCVTAASMWAMPGQALVARQVDGKPQFEFVVDPKKLVRPQRRLILPNNGAPRVS